MTPQAALPIVLMVFACLLASCQEDVPESVASNAIPKAGEVERPQVLPEPGDLAGLSSPVPYEGTQDPTEAGVCALDAINGVVVREAALRMGSVAVFGGWVGNADKQVPEAPVLVFQGKDSNHAVSFAAGAARPDVASAHGSPALATSGFNVAVRTDAIPAGRYSLVVVTDPVTGTYCDLQAAIEMRP